MALKALLCCVGWVGRRRKSHSFDKSMPDDEGGSGTYKPITESSLNYWQNMLKGRELPAREMAPVISGRWSKHAAAVKQRVKALNRTVRIPSVVSAFDNNGVVRPTPIRGRQSSAPLRGSARLSPPANSPLSSVENSPLRSPYQPVSFETLIKQTILSDDPETTCEPSLHIDQISEGEQKRLQPLLWLELASLFEKNNVSLEKRKQLRRKRKEPFNVFGVSLNALVRRDQQIAGEDTNMVPLVLQAILAELAVRGTREEGILRIAGHNQKTEDLYNGIKRHFYSKPERIDPLIKQAGVHELSVLLKRWLRELPQPLLANDLVHLFYQTNVLPPHDQLAVLCQLLPHENRNTLRELLKFFRRIVKLQDLNKMSQQNVARIIAPSFFQPRFVHPPDKNDLGAQVRMAAECCHLTNVLITMTDSLWLVPQRLIELGKMMNKNGQPKRRLRRKAKNGVVDVGENAQALSKPTI